jgi:hypothetical protein
MALAANMPQQPQAQQYQQQPQMPQQQQMPQQNWGGWQPGQQATMYGNAGQQYGNDVNGIQNWGYGQQGSNFGQNFLSAMQTNQTNANAMPAATTKAAPPPVNTYASANAANMGYTGSGGGGAPSTGAAEAPTKYTNYDSNLANYNG